LCCSYHSLVVKVHSLQSRLRQKNDSKESTFCGLCLFFFIDVLIVATSLFAVTIGDCIFLDGRCQGINEFYPF